MQLSLGERGVNILKKTVSSIGLITLLTSSLFGWTGQAYATGALGSPPSGVQPAIFEIDTSLDTNNPNSFYFQGYYNTGKTTIYLDCDGDDNIDFKTSGTDNPSNGLTCNYSSPGVKTVKLYWTTNGDDEVSYRLKRESDQNNKNLLSVKSFGSMNNWKPEGTFNSSINLATVTGTSGYVFKNGTSLMNMFLNTPKLKSIQDLNSWNIKRVVSIQGMFNKSGINQPITLETFALEDASYFLAEAPNFNSPVEFINSNKLRTLAYAFANSPKFNSTFKIDNNTLLTDISGLFMGTKYNKPVSNTIKSAHLDRADAAFYNDDFNQDISQLDSSRLKSASQLVGSSYTGHYPTNWQSLLPYNGSNKSLQYIMPSDKAEDVKTELIKSVANTAPNGGKMSFIGTYCNTNTELVNAINTLETTKNWTLDNKNPVNCSLPEITINNPGSNKATNKSVSATAPNSTLYYSVTDGSIMCNSSLSFTQGSGINFNQESHNGKRVCFKATKSGPTGELVTYKASDVIQGIDLTPPTIDPVNPDMNLGEKSKTLSASTNEGTLKYFVLSEAQASTSCDSHSPYIIGSSITFNSEADNGKRVCWYAQDEAGNTTYFKAPTVRSIDLTPPVISITEPTSDTASSKQVVANLNEEGTLKYSTLNSSEANSRTCDDTLVYSNGNTATLALETDNGSRICFQGTDTAGNISYKKSNVVNNIDNTAPILSVIEPNQSPETSKTITATSSEGTVYHSILNPSQSLTTCDDPSLSYSAGGTINFTSVSDNGKTVCFKVSDSNGNTAYHKTAEIAGIVAGPPVITINNPDTTSATGKQVSATKNRGTLYYSVLEPGNIDTQCDSSSLSYTQGNYVNFLSEADNGKKVCFKAEDNGQVSYKKSNKIEGIDRTPPVITTDIPDTTPATSKTVGASINEGTLQYHISTNHQINCTNSSVTYNNTYTSPLVFNQESDNGKVICFKATDDAGNRAFVKTPTITGIDNSVPVLTVMNPNTNKETSKVISADTTKGVVSHKLVEASVTCDDTLQYTLGNSITLTSESDNGKKVCFIAEDSIGNKVFKPSIIIEGIDITAPLLDITNPNTNKEQSKIVSATTNEGTLEYAILTKDEVTQNKTCTSLESSRFTIGQSITFTEESDNEKKVCFRATDEAGNVTNKKSISIETIDTTAPIITINNPTNNAEPTKVITASTNEGILKYKVLDQSETCDSSVSGFQNGGDTLTFGEAYNGKKACYTSTDEAGNTTYKESNVIQGIDSTGPTITINNPDSSTQKSKIVGATTNEGTLQYAIPDSTSQQCSEPSLQYQTGDSVTFTKSSDNGRVVCFKATDDANNTSYNKSSPITGIDSIAPVIDITNPNTNKEQSKIVSATTNEGTLMFSKTDESTQCNSSTLSYTNGDSVTLTEELDNESYICFKASDVAGNISYKKSAKIEGIDKTAPIINITNPNTNKAQEKIVQATVNEGTLKYKVVDNDTCDSLVTGFKIGGERLVFNEESDNGKKVCYTSTDEANNTSYKLSAEITNIDKTGPTININNPSSTFEPTKTVGATTNEGTLEYAIPTNSSQQCSEPSLQYQAGNSVTFTLESDNGKVVCFRATDDAGNIGYNKSSPVTGIDNTAPTITVTNPDTSKEQSKIVSAITDEGTLKYSIINGATTCGENLTYQDGDSVTFTSEDDNGKKVCFVATDDSGNKTYESSNIIEGIDTTAPTITITNPDTSKAKNKIVTAITNEGTLKHKVIDSTGVCNSTNKNGFTIGDTVVFTSENDNDKKVCFVATDEAGNITYKESVTIQGIDTTAPNIQVTNPSTTPEKTKTIGATTNEGTLEYSITDKNNTCDSTLTYITGNSVTLNSEGDNSKKVCFRATDDAGNTGYKGSNPIEGIDTTKPVLTITNPDNTKAQSKTVNVSIENGNLIKYSIVDHSTTCDDTLTYTNGTSVTFTEESDNGKYVCFVGSDEAMNVTYKKSDEIQGIDKTPPIIDITNPSTSSENRKTVSATTNEGNLKYSIVDESTSCSTVVNYQDGDSVTLDNDQNNGKKVCFKTIDEAGNVSHKASNKVEGLDTTLPIVTVTSPNTNPEQTKTVTAIIDEGTLKYSVVDQYTTCNNTLTYTTGTSVTFTEESDNGKKVCFEGTDSAMNKAYEASNVIKGIDKTVPVITIANTNVSTGIKVKATVNEGTLKYKVVDNDTCDPSIIDFQVGSEVIFTEESDNGKKVCFTSTDEANNTSYKLSDKVDGIDKTGPVINLQEPNTNTEKTKKIIATSPDKDIKEVKYSIEDNCSNPSYNITYKFGEDILLDSENYNGKRVCFKAEDNSGNETTTESKVIEGIQNSNISNFKSKGHIKGYKLVGYEYSCTPRKDQVLEIKMDGTVVETITTGTPCEGTGDLVLGNNSPTELTYQLKDKAGNESRIIKETYNNYEGGEILSPDDQNILENKEFEVTGIGIQNKEFKLVDEITNKTLATGTTDLLGNWKVNIPKPDVEAQKVRLYIDSNKTLSMKHYKYNFKKRSSGGSVSIVPWIADDKRVTTGPTTLPKKEEPKDTWEGYEYNGIKFIFNDKDIKKCDRVRRYPSSSIKSNFNDINRSYAKNAIGKFYNIGVVHGTSPLTFEPFRNITRAEFLAIVLRAHCIEPDTNVKRGSLPFIDIDYDNWEAGVISKAYKMGIVQGYETQYTGGKKLVMPRRPVSKIEALAIILNIKQVQLKTGEDYNHNYKDLKAKWQNKIANIAQNLNIVKEKGQLSPDSKISREWMMQRMNNIMYRYNETKVK